MRREKGGEIGGKGMLPGRFQFFAPNEFTFFVNLEIFRAAVFL